MNRLWPQHLCASQDEPVKVQIDGVRSWSQGGAIDDAKNSGDPHKVCPACRSSSRVVTGCIRRGRPEASPRIAPPNRYLEKTSLFVIAGGTVAVIDRVSCRGSFFRFTVNDLLPTGYEGIPVTVTNSTGPDHPTHPARGPVTPEAPPATGAPPEVLQVSRTVQLLIFAGRHSGRAGLGGVRTGGGTGRRVSYVCVPGCRTPGTRRSLFSPPRHCRIGSSPARS